MTHDGTYVPRWLQDDIQFPRLLAEIRAVGMTDQQYAELHETMNLERGDIDELLERAEMQWQKIKESNRGT